MSKTHTSVETAIDLKEIKQTKNKKKQIMKQINRQISAKRKERTGHQMRIERRYILFL